MKMNRKTIFCILAAVLTIAVSMYRLSMGHTAPKKLTYTFNLCTYTAHLPLSGRSRGERVSLRPSYHGKEVCTSYLQYVDAQLHYRPYPSFENYTTVDFDSAYAVLPAQPPATTLQYYLTIQGEDYYKDSPLIIRYEGDVSFWLYVPHILFLLLALFLGIQAGLYAFVDDTRFVQYVRVAAICLFIGGFALGIFVQKAAYGDYWTHYPIGYDLTCYTMLIALFSLVLAWRTQYLANRPVNRWITVAAALIMCIMYCLPYYIK